MTELAKRKIQSRYPQDTIVAINAAKAIKSEQSMQVQRGMQWINSRRAVVCLTNKRIICKDWEIPLESIKNAEMMIFKSFLSQGQVLKIETFAGMHYQFGMQHQPAWLKQTVFNIEVVPCELKMSKFSWLVRAVLMLYLGYVLFKTLL
ncbi:MAG TPA: hypothetical protein PKB05_09650 [Oligoflexia bacterium]|nr:hypothetical protein [Oligoflexia bacterium]